jgi:hypothetical protein
MTTVCGTCVCPAPVEVATQKAGDFCTMINSTHATCAIGHPLVGQGYWDAFLTGAFVAVVAIGLYMMYRYLTHPENPPEKKV